MAYQHIGHQMFSIALLEMTCYPKYRKILLDTISHPVITISDVKGRSIRLNKDSSVDYDHSCLFPINSSTFDMDDATKEMVVRCIKQEPEMITLYFSYPFGSTKHKKILPKWDYAFNTDSDDWESKVIPKLKNIVTGLPYACIDWEHDIVDGVNIQGIFINISRSDLDDS